MRAKRPQIHVEDLDSIILSISGVPHIIQKILTTRLGRSVRAVHSQLIGSCDTYYLVLGRIFVTLDLL